MEMFKGFAFILGLGLLVLSRFRNLCDEMLYLIYGYPVFIGPARRGDLAVGIALFVV